MPPLLSLSASKLLIHTLECNHWVTLFLLAGGTQQLQSRPNRPAGISLMTRAACTGTDVASPLPAWTCPSPCYLALPHICSLFPNGYNQSSWQQFKKRLLGALTDNWTEKRWMALSHLAEQAMAYPSSFEGRGLCKVSATMNFTPMKFTDPSSHFPAMAT